jgi:hypothetical protein
MEKRRIAPCVEVERLDLKPLIRAHEHTTQSHVLNRVVSHPDFVWHRPNYAHHLPQPTSNMAQHVGARPTHFCGSPGL